MLIAGSSQFLLLTLVIMRMTGFVFLNPVFGRRNIPNIFKVGLTLLLSFLIVPTVDFESFEVANSIMYGVLLLMEFALGYVVGMIMQIYEMIGVFAGSVIDYQIGMSMANVYDPQTGQQMALSSSLFQIYFLLLFFAVDGHNAIIYILMNSHDIIPYGTASISPEASQAMLNIFSRCISLAANLALPIIIFEFLVNISAGILMKMIPQINLFVISIQMRIVIGIFLLSFLISPIGDFLTEGITEMISEVTQILSVAT